MVKLAKTVLENLQGDAKALAMQTPAKDLCSPDGSGLDMLRNYLTDVFPGKMEDVKILYRAMNRSAGEPSRQH
eukprot:197688-Karenia_brevis.AAC.2